MADVREPAAAGRFYPGSARELTRSVDEMIAQAPRAEVQGEPMGILAPHAGYPFSGPVAARAYRALEGLTPEVVVIIGTSHFAVSPGLTLDSRTAYRTPLGEVPVDVELVRALRKAHPDVTASSSAHAEEHSIEVQLPFLQRTLRGFRILPVLTGLSDGETARRLGKVLADSLRGRKALVVVSADLSHYPSQADARKVDPACLQAAASLDPGYFLATSRALMELGVPELHCACCGAGAVALAMAALSGLGADRVRLLHYADSGDVSGDAERVVGYGAALFAREGGVRGENLFELTDEDKRELTALARRSLERYLRRGEEPRTVVYGNPRLNLPSGAFVTWWTRDGGELRGCVGNPFAEKTLGNTVTRYAVSSATEDSRFPSVRADELPGLRCEVSVLSPMRPGTRDDVRPGAGVLMHAAGRRGLFLPEVWEKLPGKDQFMGELCRQKLGLPWNAWKEDGVEILTFRTQAVHEG